MQAQATSHMALVHPSHHSTEREVQANVTCPVSLPKAVIPEKPSAGLPDKPLGTG